MEDALFPLIFHDGKQGYHKGIIALSPATTFDLFLRQVSLRIPGLDPQHFHIEIVCSRAGAPADARQKIPIHANTNFRVVLNQHSPTADPNAHFMVMLKRPEQRQLDQQRRTLQAQEAMQNSLLQLINQQQQQQQLHGRNLEGVDRSGPLQQPPLVGQGPPLRGAAFPWAGPHPLPARRISPQAPAHRQQANMWGAVPQHHQAIPLSQAQHLSAMAQAAANASARAQAQARHLKEGIACLGPFDFGHQSYQPHNGPQASQVVQSAALEAAHHAQHGFIVPPPPPPVHAPSPFSTRPVGQTLGPQTLGPQTLGPQSLGPQTLGLHPFGLQAHRPQGSDLQTLRSQPLEHETLGCQPMRSQLSGATPTGPLLGSVAPAIGPLVDTSLAQQTADLPFRPMRILTHASVGQLGIAPQPAIMQNVNGALQGPFLAYDAPGPDLSMHNNLAGTGGYNCNNSFWNNSPQDHVMQSFLSKKLNPFGSISSPRGTKIPSGWNSQIIGDLSGGRPNV